MKHQLILLSVPFLLGCTTANPPSVKPKIFDYTDVENKTIVWNDLFNIEKDDYFVYIYSPICGHCNEIKQEVISYSLDHDNFYYILFNKDIKITDNLLISIGATNIDDVSIVGTPTLLHIELGVLTENIVGSHAIVETLTNLS